MGQTKKGERCRRRTTRSPYCYFHLKSVEHLEIKKSTIPGAGMGLFTTIARKKNARITLYDKTMENRDPDYGGEYVVRVNDHTVANPYRTTDSAGRYANSVRKGKRNQGLTNGGLGYSAQKKEVFVKSLNKGIPAGREIKATYGHDAERMYWSYQ